MNAQNKSGEKTTPPSDVSSGYTFDYNKQWLDMISNQTVNIFIPTLLNNDKNNLIQIVFNSINYLVQSYFKSKKDLISFS